MKLVVCVKQVPNAAELAWDPKTGLLRRDQAEGMMNPACKSALEAALRLKEEHGGEIIVISMGPASAEEVLWEALGLGADRGVLLNDARFAGADTLATSYTLAQAIRTVAPDFDLILCGAQTTDSETAQVGPQMAEELDLPGVAYVELITRQGGTLQLERLTDNFLEKLEMDLPGLITVTTDGYAPRYLPLGGLEEAFKGGEINILGVEEIGADPAKIGQAGSATTIQRVYSATAEAQGVVYQGAAKKIVGKLLDDFGDQLGGLIGRDMTPAD